MPIFWYHYNKPASQKAGKPQLTVHYKKQCTVVDRIVCDVPTTTRNRKQQPHCVVAGNGFVRFNEGVAVIKGEKWA